MEEQIDLNNEEQQGRPLMLTVLCILTFIWSGLNLLSSILIYLFHDTFREAVEETAKTFKIENWEVFVNVPPLFFLTSAVISAMVITGALKMFRLQRSGFFVYTIAQILIILAYMSFYRIASPPFIDLVMGVIFVYFYSRFLKIMK